MGEAREIGIVRARGQVTIPTALRKAAGIEEGDPIEMVSTDGGILLRPKKLIDADQAWFWTPEWQAGEREASADIAAGRVTIYLTDEEFLASFAADSKTPYRTRKGAATTGPTGKKKRKAKPSPRDRKRKS